MVLYPLVTLRRTSQCTTPLIHDAALVLLQRLDVRFRINRGVNRDGRKPAFVVVITGLMCWAYGVQVQTIY